MPPEPAAGWRLAAVLVEPVPPPGTDHRVANRSVYNGGMQLIQPNPNIPGETPCFAGTRVSVHSLFDYLRRGYTAASSLSQFPILGGEQIETALEPAAAEIPEH